VLSDARPSWRIGGFFGYFFAVKKVTENVLIFISWPVSSPTEIKSQLFSR